MPTNLYGPSDNYHTENSLVIPALIRRANECKLRNEPEFVVWGTGTPRREFLYCVDMANAFILMKLPEDDCGFSLNDIHPPLVNISCCSDVGIAELAQTACDVVGYTGKIVFDTSKLDGTMRKLMDVSLLSSRGWRGTIKLKEGLAFAYEDFKKNTSSAAHVAET